MTKVEGICPWSCKKNHALGYFHGAFSFVGVSQLFAPVRFPELIPRWTCDRIKAELDSRIGINPRTAAEPLAASSFADGKGKVTCLQFLGLEHDHDADTGGRFYRASRAGLFQHRKHNHIPAPEMSFTQPNLPNLIREIETLIEKTLDD